MRNKNKYIIYTDGTANLKTKKDMRIKNSMGIGQVQTDETQEQSEEELALSLEGWQTSMIAKLVANIGSNLNSTKGKVNRSIYR